MDPHITNSCKHDFVYLNVSTQTNSLFSDLVVDHFDDERAARTRRHLLSVLQILLHKTHTFTTSRSSSELYSLNQTPQADVRRVVMEVRVKKIQ